MLENIIISLYAICLLFILLFGAGQLALLLAYLKNNKKKSKVIPLVNYPHVTIQLPVYNERFVIERLLNAVAGMEYPASKLEIQVLDDSTDDTVEICRKMVNSFRASGVDIVHLHRAHRDGFKAGALQEGLLQAKGEFIVIFDADFIPGINFLAETLPYFSTEQTGLVQTRWGHTNPNQSWLTKAQELGLNAHFIIDQQSRDKSSLFMNFNGTAGVWRKTCIIDSGGWQSDTLTEDLDLSYRAQIRGWKFRYCPNVITPAQLPFLLNAVRSQQYRWIKGGIETSKKIFFNLWKADLSLPVKIFGSFHLFSNYTYLFILLSGILSVPVMFVKNLSPDFDLFFKFNVLFSLVFLINFAYCFTAVWSDQKKLKNALIEICKAFPITIIISLGMSYHNTKAIISGMAGKKTSFIRTPKFSEDADVISIGLKGYILRDSWTKELPQIILFIYFLFAVAAGIYFRDFGFMFYHLLMLFGQFLLWFLLFSHRDCFGMPQLIRRQR